MALQDIINAIIAAADADIEQARRAHQQEMTNLREEAERSLATKKQEIASSRERKKEQLRSKAENHAAIQKRNAVLTKKRELLDRVFDAVVDKLVATDAAALETLLRSCLKTIAAKGTIHPASAHEALLQRLADSGQFTIGSTIDAKGGFLFVSDKEEADFTFEHLVQENLRSSKELDVSKQLFTS